MAAVAEETLPFISEPNVCPIKENKHEWERKVSVPVELACSRCGVVGMRAQEGWQESCTL